MALQKIVEEKIRFSMDVISCTGEGHEDFKQYYDFQDYGALQAFEAIITSPNKRRSWSNWDFDKIVLPAPLGVIYMELKPYIRPSRGIWSNSFQQFSAEVPSVLGLQLTCGQAWAIGEKIDNCNRDYDRVKEICTALSYPQDTSQLDISKIKKIIRRALTMFKE